VTISEEIVRKILVEILKGTHLKKGGFGDILRELIVFFWGLGDKVSGSLTDFLSRFFGDYEYERYIVPVREDLEKLGELAREAWKMKGKWNEFLRKYVFEESGEVKEKFRRALEVLGVPWKEWKRVYRYVDNFFWVFPTDYIRFAQRYLKPETQRSWPRMDPEFFKSTVRTFETEQRRFIDGWWSQAVQIMTDVERIWSKVDQMKEEGKEMADLKKTVEKILIESLRRVRLEKTRKGERKKVKPTPEVTEEKVTGKTPVLTVSDILDVISHGGFIEVRTVPKEAVRGQIIPVIEGNTRQTPEGEVVLTKRGLKEILGILSQEGKSFTYTVQMRSPEHADRFISDYNEVASLPLVYSDGTVDKENIETVKRTFIHRKLLDLLAHPARRNLWSDTYDGLVILLSSLRAGRYSWYRRRMKKEYSEELEKGLLTWLGDLIRPGWDAFLALRMIEKLWNTFKEKYVSRDDFVEFLNSRRMTLEEWNRLRNDFENALRRTREGVEGNVERHRRGEITRKEMREYVDAWMREFVEQHGKMLRWIEYSMEWFKERDRWLREKKREEGSET